MNTTAVYTNYISVSRGTQNKLELLKRQMEKPWFGKMFLSIKNRKDPHEGCKAYPKNGSHTQGNGIILKTLKKKKKSLEYLASKWGIFVCLLLARAFSLHFTA